MSSKKETAVAQAKAELDKATAAAREAGKRFSAAAPIEAKLDKRKHHSQDDRLAWFAAAGEASEAHVKAVKAEAVRAEAAKAFKAAEELPDEE